MPYRVTYAIDYLDPNPLVKEFEDEWDASEWLLEEIQSRIDYQVQHSPYSLSEDEVDSLHENETSLASIERV
jgi:hypothetical protein